MFAAMRLLKISIALGTFLALVTALVGATNAVDSSLIGGISAVAAYVIGASFHRNTPVVPDRHFWIGSDGDSTDDGDD